MKTEKQLERYFTGAPTHYRIAIVFLVAKQPGITVQGIVEQLDKNFKTISEHTRRLVHAGLLNKKYVGRTVAHELSPYGKRFLGFMKSF